MLGTRYDKGKRQSYSTTFPIETTTSLPVLNKKQHSSSTKLSLGSLVLSDQGAQLVSDPWLGKQE